MNTNLTSLHFYQPLLERAEPKLPLDQQLRILRQSISIYESVLGNIRRRFLSLDKGDNVEKTELREKGEWYVRTYKALKANERDIMKALARGPLVAGG